MSSVNYYRNDNGIFLNNNLNLSELVFKYGHVFILQLSTAGPYSLDPSTFDSGLKNSSINVVDVYKSYRKSEVQMFLIQTMKEDFPG